MGKVVISFICGAFACVLAVAVIRPAIPAMADENPASDNNSGFFADLLPDFDKVYREALTSPFIGARDKIHDEDIAGYYDGLMDRTGLNNPDSD